MKEERTTPPSATRSLRARRARPSRNRPLSDAARVLRSHARETQLGPYETRYEIQDGYGLDRAIIQP